MTTTIPSTRAKRAPSKTRIIKAARDGVQPSLADLQHEAVWLEWRDKIPPALHATELVTTDQSRAEFLEGARLLRLDSMPRAGDKQMGPTPIQLAIADMLNAGHKRNAVLEPRRTTKTTSIQAVMLGRCALREDYRAGWTMATTGQKTRERYLLDILTPLEKLYPDFKGGPFKKPNSGKGTEHIAWHNGSYLGIYAPNGDGFRSGGFDFAWVDEGGEAEPDLSLELLVSVLPTMDTKPGAQFVVSGTAAKYTKGNLLWDFLENERAGVMRHGIPNTTDPEELEDWEPSDSHPRARVREFIELYHPGVGYTTPLESIAENYRDFPREQFNQEYLGLFGDEGVDERIIPAPQWERAALAGDLPGVPEKFALAIAIHPDGLWASAGVAWRLRQKEDLIDAAVRMVRSSSRDVPGKVYDLVNEVVVDEYAKHHVLPDDQPEKIAIGLVHHQAGVQGFAMKVLQIARKFRVPIIYDQASQAAAVEVELFARASPAPGLVAAGTHDVRRAATKFLKLLGTKNSEGVLVHYRKQTPLQRAAEIAIKRAIGGYGGFGFGRPKGDYAADITPLEACSLALHYLDDGPSTVSPEDALHF